MARRRNALAKVRRGCGEKGMKESESVMWRRCVKRKGELLTFNEKGKERRRRE